MFCYCLLIGLLFSSICQSKLTVLDSSMQDEVCDGITINWEQDSFTNTSTSKRIYNLLGHFGGKEKFENFLSNRDTSKFIREYIVVAIPQMVFLGFTLIIIALFLIFLCKPCCNRHESKGPYSRNQLIYPTVIVIFFSIGVIVCGIFGVLYNQDFFSSFGNFFVTFFTIALEKSECAFIGTFNHFYDGTNLNDKRWLGLTEIGNIIESVSEQLDSSQTTLQNTFSKTSWLGDSKKDLTTELEDIDTKYQNLSIPSPNPQAADPVKPKILTNFGPVDNSSTTLGKIYYQQTIMTDTMADALQDLKDSVTEITEQYTNIKGNLQQGKEIISNFDVDFSKLNDDVNKVTKYTHKYQKEIHKGLLAYYIIAISIGGLVILTSFIIAFFNLIKYKLYYFLHISWCSYSLLMLVGFILSTGLMPLSLIMFSGCQVIDNAMESQTNYQTSKLFPSTVSADVIDNTQICFFGNGDLNQAFETESSLETLNQVTEGINQVKQSSISSLPSSQEYLQNFISELQDASAHVNKQVDDIPDVYMELFNAFTNTQSASSYITSCTKPSEDIWVYSQADCPNNTEIWNTSDTSTYKFGDQICIDISEFDPQVYQHHRATLYPEPQFCQNQYQTIKYESYDNLVEIVDTLQKSIYDYTVQTKEAIEDTTTSIVNYQTHLQTYVTNLNDLQSSSLATLESSVSKMLDQVSNSKTGLLTGLNCRFLNSSVTAFRSELCTEFVPQSFAFAVIIFAASFSAFWAAIGAYLLAYRVTYNLKVLGQQKGGFLLPKDNNYFKIEDDFKNQNTLDIQTVKQ